MTQTFPSEKKKRKGGAIAPLDRLCSLCIYRMPPAETYEVCKKCKEEREQLEHILREIRQLYPVTQSMHWLDIFKKLWLHRQNCRNR